MAERFLVDKRPSTLTTLMLAVLFPGAGLAYVGRVGLGLLVFGVLLGLEFAVLGAWEASDGDASSMAWSIGLVLAGYQLVGLALTWHAQRRATRRLSVGWTLAMAAGMVVLGSVARSTASLSSVEIASINMLPSLLPGDRAFVDAAPPSLERGDVVTYERVGRGPFPELWIGRLVAIGGDRVSFEDGRLSLNDKLVEHTPCADKTNALLKDPPPSSAPLGYQRGQSRCTIERLPGGRAYRVMTVGLPYAPAGTTTLGDGEVYILGDNRPMSMDSRSFGAVPVDSIAGVFRGVWMKGDWSASLVREPDRHF